MRYLISKSFLESTQARRQYLFDAVQLWTIEHPFANNFLTLESMPACSLDIFFIVGHNAEVNQYLTKHHSLIHEQTVVIITCGCNVDLSVLKNNKEVYISHQSNNHQAELLIGEKFGFDFDLTESELIFYNNQCLKTTSLRLTQAFTKIK